jgi:hypothetical protein
MSSHHSYEEKTMKNTLLLHMRHFLLIILSTLSLAVGLAGLTVQHAYAATQVPSDDTCSGASCYGQDPVTFHCLDSYTISPDNKPESYGGIIVGSFSVVYSYTCNAYWAQATLDAFAINQGFRVAIGIATIDSLGNSELTCYPVNCNLHTGGYGGETGWPAYSNMVDGSGSNEIRSTFALTFPDGSFSDIDTVALQYPKGVG